MGTDFDLGPAKAEFQKGDSFGNGGVAARISTGLLKFLAQPSERLGIEYCCGLDLLGSCLIHHCFQKIKVTANRLGRWPETGLAVVINKGVDVLFWVPMQASHDVVI